MKVAICKGQQTLSHRHSPRPTKGRIRIGSNSRNIEELEVYWGHVQWLKPVIPTTEEEEV
jgi:hypothetical protein